MEKNLKHPKEPFICDVIDCDCKAYHEVETDDTSSPSGKQKAYLCCYHFYQVFPWEKDKCLSIIEGT